MKKNIPILLFILSINILNAQTPNFANIHNVVTTKKATCVKISGTKLFYGTNDPTDKALYMYDISTGIKTTIDTAYGVRNMTRVNYLGNEYYVICTDFFGFTIDNTGNKIGTFIMNSTGGFYDVVWNPIQQKLYWGCPGKIMYSNWNFGMPTSVSNPFFGNSGCIATTLECNNDTIYIGYKEPASALGFIKYYNYNYISTSAYNGNSTCTDGAILGSKYYMCRNLEIYTDAISTNSAYHTNTNLFYSAIENISNTLWIASTNNVIFKFNGTFSTSQMNGTTYNVPTVDTIYDMEIDMVGQMWVASKNGLHTTANTSTTGLNDLENINSIKMYPNPSNNFITIRNIKEGSFTITNLMGQIVLKDFINENLRVIDISEINSGIYFIQVFDAKNNEIGITKLIKQ